MLSPRCRPGPRRSSRNRSGNPAWRNSSQASPSSTADSWRELRSACEGSQDQDEEDEDREHGEAEDPAAVALFEGEGREQRVGDFGAGDDRQPEPGEEQDQDVGVAQRASAGDRVADQDQAEHQPAARSAVSSEGKTFAVTMEAGG